MISNFLYHFIPFLRKDFLLFICRDREGRKKERETSMWERNIDQSPLVYQPTRYQTHNPGICPNQESNWRLFALWNDTKPTEPYRSGLFIIFFEDIMMYYSLTPTYTDLLFIISLDHCSIFKIIALFWVLLFDFQDFGLQWTTFELFIMLKKWGLNTTY